MNSFHPSYWNKTWLFRFIHTKTSFKHSLLRWRCKRFKTRWCGVLPDSAIFKSANVNKCIKDHNGSLFPKTDFNTDFSWPLIRFNSFYAHCRHFNQKRFSFYTRLHLGIFIIFTLNLSFIWNSSWYVIWFHWFVVSAMIGFILDRNERVQRLDARMAKNKLSRGFLVYISHNTEKMLGRSINLLIKILLKVVYRHITLGWVDHQTQFRI